VGCIGLSKALDSVQRGLRNMSYSMFFQVLRNLKVSPKQHTAQNNEQPKTTSSPKQHKAQNKKPKTTHSTKQHTDHNNTQHKTT
jgi:hypothetical protein